jgi:hypothetical protein
MNPFEHRSAPGCPRHNRECIRSLIEDSSELMRILIRGVPTMSSGSSLPRRSGHEARGFIGRSIFEHTLADGHPGAGAISGRTVPEVLGETTPPSP